ncbi:MAG: ribonuclease P protein component [Cyanobacteria bacterium P01_F01_bin.150]
MALPKQHRLRHRRDFARVYRSGLRRKSRHLTLRALKVFNNTASDKLGSDGEIQSSALVASSSHRQKNHSLNYYSSGVQPTQIGITISTKVSKRANVRNRIKRQIQAAMFQLLPAFSSNWLIVIIVRPGVNECDYWQFLRELEEMIKILR